MNNEYHFELTDSAEPNDIQVIREGLDAYDATQGAPVDWKPLYLFLRDGQGNIVGGLTGGTYWGWLYIGRLWLVENMRGLGYGSRLLIEAEQEALKRGCHHTYLDTQDFQALRFYQKHGYTIYGELEDMPLGHKRYSLQKKLEQG
jgi:GNAT superfamily N-acetyltransferase